MGISAARIASCTLGLLCACEVDSRLVETGANGGCGGVDCADAMNESIPTPGVDAGGDASEEADDSSETPERPGVLPGGFNGSTSTAACPLGGEVSAPSIDTASPPISASELEAFADPERFEPGGLCVFEPPVIAGGGPALYPYNWLRPRFRWESSGVESLWEIRLTRATPSCVVRAYTRSKEWVVPLEVWNSLARSPGPIEFTIRGAGAGGALVGMGGSFEIAPANVRGKLVFSAMTSASVSSTEPTRLMSLTLGDDAVTELLRPADVQTANIPDEDGALARGSSVCGTRPTCVAAPTNPACCDPTGYAFGTVECVGCHAATPDGAAVAFGDNWPANELTASIAPESRGALPVTVTPYAANLLKQPWLGMATFSEGHFTSGDRTLVTTYGVRANPATAPYDFTPPSRFELAWFDLEANDLALPIPELIPPNPPLAGQTQSAYDVAALRNQAVGAALGTAWGRIAMVGEAQSVMSPAWSHNGSQIAYVSTDVTTPSGSPAWTANVADVRVVPYGNRNGGVTFPVPGASDPGFLEYFPAYSPDDAFLAFTRAPTPSVPTRCVPTQDANGVVLACPLQDLGENPDGPYYNRNGEIFIVPRDGGTPIRLSANDPVTCSGESSRGSINSWPQWLSLVRADGKAIYFIAFSSARKYGTGFDIPRSRLTPPVSRKSSQLYLAAIVVDDATGAVETRPAIYLSSQSRVLDAESGSVVTEQTSNFNPTWAP